MVALTRMRCLPLLVVVVGASKWPLRGPREHVDAIPASFDCGMRKLAYDYGRKLLPRLGAFEPLFYALGLNENRTCPTRLGLLDDQARPPARAASSPALPEGAVFVDAVRGSDDNPGSERAPKRTVHGAVRAARKGAPVILRGGSHYLESTLQLGPEHAGLVIRNFPGEVPVLSGGKSLRPNWKPYNTESQRVNANIYVASLKGEVAEVPGLQLGGVRATRARYPNLPGGIEVSPGYGAMVDGGKADWTPPQFDRFGPVKYFTDDTPAHRRNVSADDWFQQYMIGTSGLCSVYDPPVSYWCSERPSGGGAFPFRTPSGVAPRPGALPRAPYEDVSQMVFFVWRPARWANWMFKVADRKSVV